MDPFEAFQQSLVPAALRVPRSNQQPRSIATKQTLQEKETGATPPPRASEVSAQLNEEVSRKVAPKMERVPFGVIAEANSAPKKTARQREKEAERDREDALERFRGTTKKNKSKSKGRHTSSQGEKFEVVEPKAAPMPKKEVGRRTVKSEKSLGIFANAKKADHFVSPPPLAPVVTAVSPSSRIAFDDAKFFNNAPKPKSKKTTRKRRKAVVATPPPTEPPVAAVISELESELLHLGNDMEVIAEELDSSLRRFEQSPSVTAMDPGDEDLASDLQCEEESIFHGIGDAWLG